MQQIVECVPNFSEGRDAEVIEAIAAAIRDTDGCKLVDVDPGASTNRTVYTFVGDPDSVAEGALNAARVARDRIDMARHEGEHPRFGALDVCPFVPVSHISMEECARISEEFGRRLPLSRLLPVPSQGIGDLVETAADLFPFGNQFRRPRLVAEKIPPV